VKNERKRDMKIDEFIDGFEKARDKDNFVKGVIVKNYLNYENKIAICQSIINQSMYRNVNNKKMFVIDSPKRWMFFVFSIVSSYTSIEVPEDGMERMKLFNQLQKYNVMANISNVLAREYQEFATLLNTMVEDEIRNNDLKAMLETKIEAISMVASRIPWERLMSKNENPVKGK
jgi:hypothetical protein